MLASKEQTQRHFRLQVYQKELFVRQSSIVYFHKNVMPLGV